MKRWVLVFYASLGVSVGSAQEYVSPEAASGRADKSNAAAKSYMVVAANPLAVKAGTEILAGGGSAVDAAVAVQLMLGLVEPQSSGIGGGSFIVYWDAKAKKLTTFDGRETAPSAATERRFLTAEGTPMDRETAIIGGHSVGVPGTVRVLEMAQKRYGRLAWPKLFGPAIRTATDGFAVSPRLHELLDADPSLKTMQPTGAYFYTKDGNALPVGFILKNPAYARTLKTIAAKGADAFYMGPIAADIVRAAITATHPSDITLTDLENYKAVERSPVCRTYRDHNICSMGPPTSGGIGVLQTLALLEKFDMKALGARSLPAHNAIIEAGRLVFADRAAYIADPDVLPVPTDALLSDDYLASRSSLMNLNKRIPKAEPGVLPKKETRNWYPAASPEQVSTSHFSIIDADGNAVAMTTSIEAGFGSKVMVDGFLLNNTLTDFSYSDIASGQVVANAVGPNKRPRSSMAPTVVFDSDGKLEMVLGSPGGPAIVGFVAQTLVAMIDWGLTPQEAVSVPHVIVFGQGVMIEPGLEALEPGLETLGHKIRIGEFPSGVHAIRVTKDGLLGGADPRREGAVGGK